MRLSIHKLGAALQGKVDALWLMPDPVCAAPAPFQPIQHWAQTPKIPIVAFAERYVREGARWLRSLRPMARCSRWWRRCGSRWQQVMSLQ